LADSVTTAEESVAARRTTLAGRTRSFRHRTFDAFSSPAFRLLWLNNLSFALINGIQRFAFVWLVLEITGGPGAAGLVTFALGIPVLFLSIPAGVISDRLDRRSVLLVSQTVALVVAVLTAGAIWTGAASLPLAVLLALAMGTTTAFGVPVRQAIVPSLVEREKLMNAIVLNTLGQNVSMIVGPTLGGVLISLGGIGGSFAGMAVLYAIGAAVLIPLRVPRATAAPVTRRPIEDVREGFRFVSTTREIRSLMQIMIASGLLMMGPTFALLPQIAKEELGRDALDASLLFTYVGLGMVCTSLFLAAVGSLKKKGTWFLAMVILGGPTVAGMGLSGEYALTAAIMFAWGMQGGFFINLNQTLIQSNTPQALMGRVMSIYSLGFMGLMPMGSLAAGGMAAAIGAPVWLACSGGLLSLVSVLILVRDPGLRKME
jgi:MFS family permease